MWVTWILAVEAITIVTTNTVTIVTFTRTPRLHMRKYCLLVNLAVADLLVGLLAVSVNVYLLQTMERSGMVYKLGLILDPFLSIASLLGLAAVAIERTYATYYPFKHRTMSKTPYTIGIAVVWSTALLFTLTIAGYFYKDDQDHDVVNYVNRTTVLTSISLPLVIVVCAYFLIWVKITCMRNVLGHAIPQRNSKLSVTLAIVTIVSLIAWLPFMACSAFFDSCYFRFSINFFNMLKVLHYGNSLVNFIIYSLRMPDFRAGMRAQVFKFSICHAVHVTENVLQRNDIDLQNQTVEANV